MKGIKTTLEGKPALLACRHWKEFPPVAAELKLSAEDLRKRGLLNDQDYQRVQVWERVCGLAKMDADTCLQCPNVRKVTRDHTGVFLSTLDGKLKSRIQDSYGAKTFREGLAATQRPPGTPGSKTDAAWVTARKDEAAEAQRKSAPPVPGGVQGKDGGGQGD